MEESVPVFPSITHFPIFSDEALIKAKHVKFINAFPLVPYFVILMDFNPYLVSIYIT